MSSIVLTEAELAQVPSGVIVTPGDRCRSHVSGDPTMCFIAPARWAALEGPCELRARCERCRGRGETGHHVGDFYEVEKCPACTFGSVFMARASVEVLSIGDALEGYLDEPRFVLVGETGAAIFDATTTSPDFLTLDPLPVPGRDFVVVLSDVEMAT